MPTPSAPRPPRPPQRVSEPWDNRRAAMNPLPKVRLLETQDPDDRAHGFKNEYGYVPARALAPHQSRPRLYAAPAIVVLRAGPRGAPPMRMGVDSHAERLERWHHAVRTSMEDGLGGAIEDRVIGELRGARAIERMGFEQHAGTASPMAMAEHIGGLPRSMPLSALHADTREGGGTPPDQRRLEDAASAMLRAHGFTKWGGKDGGGDAC